MLQSKVITLLGFAVKSGKLLLGEYSVESGIKTKKAKLVILAEDVSLRRRNILQLWCADRNIAFLVMGTKEEFGKLLCKKPLGLLAVTDGQMAKAICEAAVPGGGD